MKRILCLKVENGSGHRNGVGFRPPFPTVGLKPILPTRNSAPPSIDTLKAVAAQCKRFTPLVGIDPDLFPQSVLLDITNVLHLSDDEAALVQRILHELQTDAWQLRAAVAATPGAAWALAWYGEEKESPPVSLSSLPLGALRLPELIVTLLHSLGVWRIEQLEALPRRELTARFGPDLLDCLDRVTGRLPEPLPAWDPPPQFEVHWSAEFPTARRETIEAALEHLVRRLAAMLNRAGRGAMRLGCCLKCAAGELLQLSVGLFCPSAWANHLVQLLAVQLETLQLPGPVDSIHLTAASTAPLELRQQEMFCQGQTRVGPQHLSGLIDRLSNRLGHACVTRVQLIPDAQPELACHYTPLVGIKGSGLFFIANPKAGTAAQHGSSRNGNTHKRDPTPLCQPRPLRLLTQPLRLSGGIDGVFSLAGRQQGIVRRMGPERIETGWWRGRTVARDYYRIETTTGRCYWVFRRLPDGPWFLHGIFD
jgi:protein ImuB